MTDQITDRGPAPDGGSNEAHPMFSDGSPVPEDAPARRPPNQGSFNWYLSHYSGDFVRSMARAIQRADAANLERIRRAFPQMVAAFRCPSWEQVPKDFAPEYNAD